MEGDSNLEVDARHSDLYSSPGESEPKYRNIEPDGVDIVSGGAYAYRNPVAERPRRILGFRRTTFVLSAIVTILLILGIVSAVGAGTCASKNGGFTGSNPPAADKASSQLVNCPTTTPAPQGNSTNNTTSPLQPTDDCQHLPPQYGAAINKEQFTLYCDTDFGGNDFLGVYVYKFEDCIEACANFNYWGVFDANCTHVSYNLDPVFAGTGRGNCYLKNGTGVGTSSIGTSGAVLVKV